MMNAVVHPGRERLLTLLVPASTNVVDAKLQEHIEQCPLCQREVQALTKDLDALRRRAGVAVVDRAGAHPSDADIVAYVGSSLDVTQRRLIDAHLASCGVCMKEVLRLRAHRAAQRGRVPDAAESQEVVPLRTPNQRGRNTVWWQGVVAASVAVVTVSVWTLRGTPGVAPDGQTTVPSIAQVNPIQETPVATPAPVAEPVIVAEAPVITAPNKRTPAAAPVDSPMTKVALGVEGVNWQAGVIETTAVGTVDMSRMKNPVHAEVTAENTARHLAYAQLAEMIDGVRVTSDVSYRDLSLRVGDLKVQTDGFIRGAEVVKKSLEWVSGVPKATITLRVRLFGRDGVGGMTERYVLPDGGKAVAPQRTGRARNRVLVDARGTGFAPALHVALQAGSLNATIPVTGSATDGGYALRYVASMDEALADASNGASPIIVKAAARSAPGVLSIDGSDAALAHVEQADFMVVF